MIWLYTHPYYAVIDSPCYVITVISNSEGVVVGRGGSVSEGGGESVGGSIVEEHSILSPVDDGGREVGTGTGEGEGVLGGSPHGERVGGETWRGG